MLGHTCSPLPGATQQHLAMLQGHAESGLLPFSKGEKTKTGPQVSQMGMQMSHLDVRGLRSYQRAQWRATVRSQGSAGHWGCTATQKGPTTGCGVPLGRGVSFLCHFSPKKGTVDGIAAPQGHLWRRPGGTSLPDPSPRHLTLTGINSPQLHCSGPFQGHDPITCRVPPEQAHSMDHSITSAPGI